MEGAGHSCDASNGSPSPSVPLGSAGTSLGREGKQRVQVAWGAATDAGGRRPANEDAVLAQPPVFLVADGMGGHVHGAMASDIVVRTFAEFSDSWHPDLEIRGDDVQAVVRVAQQRLRAALAQSGEAVATAGSTVAGAVLTVHEGAPYWLIFNVGDSRVYRWAQGRLSQVSVDHSVVQELVDAGLLETTHAEQHPQRHVITRAVDTGKDTAADFWLLAAAPDERLLLCSDGLLGEISHDQIGTALSGSERPSDAAEHLLAEATTGGAADNVSVVVVDLAGTADVARTTPRPEHDGEAALATTVPREQGRLMEGTQWQ